MATEDAISLGLPVRVVYSSDLLDNQIDLRARSAGGKRYGYHLLSGINCVSSLLWFGPLFFRGPQISAKLFNHVGQRTERQTGESLCVLESGHFVHTGVGVCLQLYYCDRNNISQL